MIKVVANLAWPAAFEALFIGMIDLTDTAMVSALGIEAVAAVGLTSQPKRILLMPILAVNVGATALISRFIGAGDEEGANRAMHQFLLICAIISAFLYFLGFLFARSFMLVCGAEADTVGLSTAYFRIIVLGQFVQALGLTINACQRGAGNTKIAMFSNVAANLFNVAFNYLLIYGKLGFPRLGVVGAAIATALGCLMSFLISVYTVAFNRSGSLSLHLSKEFWRLDHKLMEKFKVIAISAFGEQFFQRLGMFFYVLIVAKLGTMAFGTYQICMNIANFEGCIFDGFAIAATALMGQGLGAKRQDLAERYSKYIVYLSYLTAVIISIPMVLFRSQIMAAFSSESDVVRYGGIVLMIISAASISTAGSASYAGVLRGAGDTKAVALWTMWSTTVLRPIISWILCYCFGLNLIGVWLGFLAGYLIRWIGLTAHFRKGGWKAAV